MPSKTTNAIIAVVVVIIIVVAVVAVYFVYFNGDDDDKKSGGELGEVTDAAGNVIKLEEVPDRIVSVSANTTEILCNLGFRSNLVGVSNDNGIYDLSSTVVGISYNLDFPGTIKSDLASGKLIDVGGYYSWSVESVAACDPGLVLMEYGQIQYDTSYMTQLQSLGITVIVISSDYGIQTIYENYSMLGTALGATGAADEIISQMQNVTGVIYDTVGTKHEVKFAYICYCYGYYYIYDTSAQMDFAEALGCTNALPTSAGYAIITAEDIAAADPDVIVFDDMGTYLDWTDVVAEWKADPVMGSISAIANDNFYCLEIDPFESLNHITVHFIEGEALLANILFQDELGQNVPNILTNENWRDYITWLDAYL